RNTLVLLIPVVSTRRSNPPLTPRQLGVMQTHLNLHVSSKFFLGNRQMTLREMIAALENIYAGSIRSEFMHIQNTRVRNWVLHRLESRPGKAEITRGVLFVLLRELLEAVSFEGF